MARDLILKEMDRLRGEVDRMFKGFLDFPKMSKLKLHIETPKTEMKETDKEFVLKVGMPGMKKTDIDLNVSSKALEVRAQQKAKIKVKKQNFMKEEHNFKGFYRIFPLPMKVLPDKSKALYKKGVLEIHLPKAHGKIKEKIKQLKIN